MNILAHQNNNEISLDQFSKGCNCHNCRNAEEQFESTAKRITDNMLNYISKKHQTDPDDDQFGSFEEIEDNPVISMGKLLYYQEFRRYSSSLLNCPTVKDNARLVAMKANRFLTLSQNSRAEDGPLEKDVMEYMHYALLRRYKDAISKFKLKPSKETLLRLMLILSESDDSGPFSHFTGDTEFQRLNDEIRSLVAQPLPK